MPRSDSEVSQDFGLGVGDLRREGLAGAVDGDGGLRSGRSCLTTLAMARPVLSWMAWETARAVNTMLRCASIDSRTWWKIGRARRSVLDIRKERSTCQSSWYLPITSLADIRAGIDVGDIAFQPDQCARPGQACFIESALIAGDGDEPGGLGLLLSGDDLFGAGFLGVEGFCDHAVPGRLCTARSPATLSDARPQSIPVRL